MASDRALRRRENGQLPPSRTVIQVRNRHRGRRSLLAFGPSVYLLEKPISAGNGGAGVPPPNFANGECTYWAYQKRPDIFAQSVSGGAPAQTGWNAENWAYNASRYGHYAEGTVPEKGAIMVEPGRPGNPEGHVAYVTQVIDASHFVTTEMNTDAKARANVVFTVYDDTAPNPILPATRRATTTPAAKSIAISCPGPSSSTTARRSTRRSTPESSTTSSNGPGTPRRRRPPGWSSTRAGSCTANGYRTSPPTGA